MGLPVDPGQADLNPPGTPFSAQELFKEPSKIPSLFSLIFERILARLWFPKWLPKPPKINKKSMQNGIWSEKCDFSKNSISPKRDTHFGGSRVPKTLQKSTKNAPGTDQKSNQNFDRNLNGFLNDFTFYLGSRLGTRWAPKSLKTRVP